MENTILPEGSVEDLDLIGSRRITIRDYDGDPSIQLAPIPIHVRNSMALNSTSTLSIMFEAECRGPYNPPVMSRTRATLLAKYPIDVGHTSS